MINFRYHVVSMTAVFLALAIGLVLGTTALNGPLADGLNANVNSFSALNKNLRDQVSQLETELKKQEEFATELAPTVLGGKLAGKKILLVDAPGVKTDQVDGVRKMLETAGAKVTGRLSLTDDFTSPTKADQLLSIVTTVMPKAITDPPMNMSAPESASYLLAAVLMVRTPEVPKDQRTAVLAGMTALHVIATTGDLAEPADAVVFVGGPPATDQSADKRNAAVLTAVTQFARPSGKPAPIVVVAPNASGNVVAEVRSDPTLSQTISTVDNVSGAQGQLVTALTMIDQFAGKAAGHYGLGAGATALTPKFEKK